MYPWYVFALLSVAFSITYGLLNKKLLTNTDNHDPIAFASVIFISVAVITAVVYVLTGGNWRTDLASFSTPIAVSLLFANVLCYALAASCYWRALKYLPASEVSILYDLTTVYIFVFGVLLGTEVFSFIRLAGGLLIVSSVLLLTVATSKNKQFQTTRYFWMMMAGTFIYAFAALSDNAIISRGYFSPLFFQILNFGIPALLLLLINPRSISHVRRVLKPSVLRNVVFSGVFLFLATWALYHAYDVGGVTSEVNFVAASETALTVFFAAIFLRERDHIPVKICCAILATAGILLLI